MENIKQVLIAATFLCLFQAQAGAQQIYRTREGVMSITMKYKDSTLIASSHSLIALLNYETGEISFRIPYASFRTGIDSIDANLIKLENQWMEFKGKLGIPYINTKKHPPQNFGVEGTMLSAIPPTNVTGKGSLIHIASGSEYSCRLTLKIQFSLSLLNIQQAFYNTSDPIQIDIQQTVLKRVND